MPYLRVEDGGSVVVLVKDGVVEKKDIHWIGNRSQDCAGDDCGLCKAEIPAQTRYQMAVEKSGQEVVWDMSSTVYDQLTAFGGDLKDLAGELVRVSRKGKGLETRYGITLVMDDKPTSEGGPVITDNVTQHLLNTLFAAISDARFLAIIEEKLGG